MCAGVCIRAHTLHSPLDFQCVCLSMCALCLDSWSGLYLTQPHSTYLPVKSRCDLNDGSTQLQSNYSHQHIPHSGDNDKMTELRNEMNLLTLLTACCQNQTCHEMQISIYTVKYHSLNGILHSKCKCMLFQCVRHWF